MVTKTVRSPLRPNYLLSIAWHSNHLYMLYVILNRLLGADRPLYYIIMLDILINIAKVVLLFLYVVGIEEVR